MLPARYKKSVLNRVTSSQEVVNFLENSRDTENDVSKYSFHKIVIPNWTGLTKEQQFELLSQYYVVTFIPVHYEYQDDITTFYTNNINLVLKIIKFDFVFLSNRNVFNINIFLCDKTSKELFGDQNRTLEDIIVGRVSLRFGPNFELDLSNFCNDAEFISKRIEFYKLTLLANYKILMIRMGRDTKYLNISNNNLSKVPLSLLNFFVKGDLIGIDLSNNNISSMVNLQRVSSKIEKLKIEQNPLCGNMGPITYIKQMIVKFPRLTELDGISLNNHGIMLPFYRSFVINPDNKTKIIIENFVKLYFSHYDLIPRNKIEAFYDAAAVFTVSSPYAAEETDILNPKVYCHTKNILSSNKKILEKRIYKSAKSIVGVLSGFPPTVHDTTTFTIDVLYNDNKQMMLIVDGVYKEPVDDTMSERLFNFRRTFMFWIYTVNNQSFYKIMREMFTITLASDEMKHNSFMHPIRHENQLTLIDPDSEEQDTVCRAFTHYTQLRRSEVERRLRKHNWDMRVALTEFMTELRNNTIPADKFIDEDDLSDISSLLDDVD